MAEKEFVEEFFMHAIKARKEKERAKAMRGRVHAEHGGAKHRGFKKSISGFEGISGQEFEPEKEEKETGRKKPEIAPLPSEMPHVPAPPMKFILGEPRIPVPPSRAFENNIRARQAIDLGVLNRLVNDSSVEAIECDGSFMPVKIIKDGENINTEIELNDREITDIINKFAQKSGMQAKGPVFKATVGSLEISAVISGFAGTKFVITKR